MQPPGWKKNNRRGQALGHGVAPTLSQALDDLARRLSMHSETPWADAQVLAASVLDRPRAWVIAHPEAVLSPDQVEEFIEKGSQLDAGQPLPYVLGRWEFFGLEFSVSPDVLIPRPETELLVEQALDWLKTRSDLSPEAGSLVRAADVGAGSGCIAIALAANCPSLQVIASDVSLPALRLARRNVLRHSLAGRVLCVQADLLPSVGQPINLVCANLPYIPTDTLRALDLARWEPNLALWGGSDGLLLIRRLLEQLSPDAVASPLSCSQTLGVCNQTPRGCNQTPLSPHSLVLLEIEASLGPAVLSLAQKAFPQAEVSLLVDLAGRDRCVRIETSS